MTRFFSIFAVLLLAGCAATGPKRTTIGGSTSASTATTQTAVAPVYPPAYPARVVTVQTPATQPNPSVAVQPSTITDATFYPPSPPAPPTVLTSTTAATATTQPSTIVDIIPPKSWGGYWIGLCLLIAAGCAVAATVTPVKRLYGVAVVAAALATLALVPPAYLGLSLLVVVAALIAAVGALAWRAGMWQHATVQVVRGVEAVKHEVGDPDEVNRMLAAEQDQQTKRLVRKARGK